MLIFPLKKNKGVRKKMTVKVFELKKVIFLIIM